MSKESRFNYKEVTGILMNEHKIDYYKNDLRKYVNQVKMIETGMIIDIVAWNDIADRVIENYKQGESVTLFGQEKSKTITNKYHDTYEFHEFNVKGTIIPKKPKLIKPWTEEEIHSMFLKRHNLTQEQFDEISNSSECIAFMKRMKGEK